MTYGKRAGDGAPILRLTPVCLQLHHTFTRGLLLTNDAPCCSTSVPSRSTLVKRFPTWIRTTILASRAQCPAVRRWGKVGCCLPALTRCYYSITPRGVCQVSVGQSCSYQKVLRWGSKIMEVLGRHRPSIHSIVTGSPGTNLWNGSPSST